MLTHALAGAVCPPVNFGAAYHTVIVLFPRHFWILSKHFTRTRVYDLRSMLHCSFSHVFCAQYIDAYSALRILTVIFHPDYSGKMVDDINILCYNILHAIACYVSFDKMESFVCLQMLYIPQFFQFCVVKNRYLMASLQKLFSQMTAYETAPSGDYKISHVSCLLEVCLFLHIRTHSPPP